MSYFYGADLADNTNKARDLGNELKNQGYKNKSTWGLDPNKLCKDMTEQFAADMVNGKFKCEGGVLFVYVSSHGGTLNNESYITNQREQFAKLTDFTNCLAGVVPPCCTLVFAIDACETNFWWDQNIDANGNFKAGSGLKNTNCVVVMPEAELCAGSPVYNGIGNNLDERRTAAEFCTKMDSLPMVRAACNLDARHKDTIVTVPEPSSCLAPAAALTLVGLRRRRSSRAPARRVAGRLRLPLLGPMARPVWGGVKVVRIVKIPPIHPPLSPVPRAPAKSLNLLPGSGTHPFDFAQDPSPSRARTPSSALARLGSGRTIGDRSGAAEGFQGLLDR